MSEDDFTFENTSTEADETYPAAVGDLKKGGYVMIQEHPCKIIGVSSGTKDGDRTTNITALDIFTDKKYTLAIPSGHRASVPVVSRAEYTLVDVTDDGFVSLMSEDGEIRDDVKLPAFPEDFAEQLRDEFDAGRQLLVSVLSACGTDQIVSKRDGMSG